MTTAHRPTWHPAVGTANQGGYRYHVARQQFSSRDLPGHLKLKTRQPGQGTQAEVAAKDLKAELEFREKKAKGLTSGSALMDVSRRIAPADHEDEVVLVTEQVAVEFDEEDENNYDDEDEDLGDHRKDNDDDDDEEEDDDEDDDEDEDELLRQELEKIRKEREQERKQQEEEEALMKGLGLETTRGVPVNDPEARFVSGFMSNPLASSSSAKPGVKRRWDDDVVFRNQAKDEATPKKRFINDTIRNDFHLKFIKRYIK